MKILIIPDTQVKPGVDIRHLTACGNYIVEKKPDVIVHIGDHYDMESLSSYSSNKDMEGRRILADLKAGKDAMQALLDPIHVYNEQKRKWKEKTYRPQMHFCLGNHEARLERYIDNNPSLQGVMSYPEAFELEEYGFTVHDFKKPVIIGGIAFAHYFYNPMSGRPYGGKCHAKLNNIKTSFVMGHQQGFDVATTTGNDGKRYWGIVAGSFYTHEEGYIGPQANDHWRGLVMLHDVNDGDCEIMTVGMKHLLDKYL